MLGGLETSDVLKINVVDKKYKVNRKWKYLSTSTQTVQCFSKCTFFPSLIVHRPC